jgi:hypothetical protein
MSRELQAKSLTKEDVDRAFGLIRSAGGEFTLARWRRYAGQLIRRGPANCGLLAVENSRGTIQGLCSYRMVSTPEGDRHCVVESIVALDLIDEGEVTAGLLQAIELIARRLGAQALSVSLPYRSCVGGSLLARLDSAGMRIDRLRLLKPLPP